MNKEKRCGEQAESSPRAERRTSSRIDVELRVKLQSDEFEIGAYAASNVSAGGLCLRGNFKSIFPGDVLSVDFVDIAKEEYRLNDMRALVLNRTAHEGHLTWLDCDSLFWIKLLKLLARAATDNAAEPSTHEVLLRDASSR